MASVENVDAPTDEDREAQALRLLDVIQRVNIPGGAHLYADDTQALIDAILAAGFRRPPALTVTAAPEVTR